MNKTLIVSFHPREGSNTKKIVDAFRQAAGDKTELIERNLDEQYVPLVNKAAMATWWDSEGNSKSELESVSAELIAELKAADRLVIAAPVYNFGMPASLKAWVDLVVRAGKTFQFGESGSEPLLKFKDTAVIMTTGGMTIGQQPEMMSSLLTSVTGYISGSKPVIVGAEMLNGVSDEEAVKRVEAAQSKAEELAGKWYS